MSCEHNLDESGNLANVKTPQSVLSPDTNTAQNYATSSEKDGGDVSLFEAEQVARGSPLLPNVTCQKMATLQVHYVSLAKVLFGFEQSLKIIQ